ncbi:MAG: TIGR02186 family protein [Thermodesulfobacteriota bacterium]
MKMITTMKQWAAVAAVLLALSMPATRSAQALTCEVNPTEVPITLAYHGAKLTITGESAASDDLVLKISTDPHDTAMKRYGKAGGLVWMKVGTLEFKGVPGVYLLNTTADLNRILAPAARAEHLLGYEALGAAVAIDDPKGEPVDHAKWFDQFIQFKEKEAVYNIQQGTITRQHGKQGNTFTIEVAWPYQAPPGTYNVELLAVNNGTVVDKAATSFEVKREGMVAFLSKMAIDQALLYGIMAVIIAMAAGFAVGAIFKKGGGAH